MEPGQEHEAIKPISWLIGTWLSADGSGVYPTIKPFCYNEEITFESLDLPIINYSAKSWHPDSKKPMHFDSGYLKIKPGTSDLYFLDNHNFGLSVVEEGVVEEEEKRIILTSKSIERMPSAKGSAVTKTQREITLSDGILKQVFKMETENTPLQVHLTATYKKVSDS